MGSKEKGRLLEHSASGPQSPAQSLAQCEPLAIWVRHRTFPRPWFPKSAPWLGVPDNWVLHPPCEDSALHPSQGAGDAGPGISQGSCQHRNLGKWRVPASPPRAAGRQEIHTNDCLTPVATTGYANLGSVFMGEREFLNSSHGSSVTLDKSRPSSGLLLCSLWRGGEEVFVSPPMALNIRDRSSVIKNSGSPVSGSKP